MVLNVFSVGGRAIGESDSNGRRDYLLDPLFTVTGTVNSAGSVSSSYTFTPFGVNTSFSGTAPTPAFGWQGSRRLPPSDGSAGSLVFSWELLFPRAAVTSGSLGNLGRHRPNGGHFPQGQVPTCGDPGTGGQWSNYDPHGQTVGVMPGFTPIYHPCGEFLHLTNWSLSGGKYSQHGTIIQHNAFDIKFYSPSGGIPPGRYLSCGCTSDLKYIEAWLVSNGTVQAPADRYQWSGCDLLDNCPCLSGGASMAGRVAYYDNCLPREGQLAGSDGSTWQYGAKEVKKGTPINACTVPWGHVTGEMQYAVSPPPGGFPDGTSRKFLNYSYVSTALPPCYSMTAGFNSTSITQNTSGCSTLNPVCFPP